MNIAEMFTINSYDHPSHRKRVENDYKNLLEVVPDIKGIHKKKAIDIGCGIGLHVNKYSSLMAIVGIDKNEAFINHAKQNNPNCVFFCEGIENFKPIENTKFDLIFCYYHVVNNTDDFNLILNFSRKYIASNGFLIIEPLLKENVIPYNQIKLNIENDSYIRTTFNVIEGQYLIKNRILKKNNQEIKKYSKKMILCSKSEFLHHCENYGFSCINIKNDIFYLTPANE